MNEPTINNYNKGMFDVSNKADTLRYAIAQAIIKVTPETVNLIKNHKTPKGDIIEAAKISATLGAKKNMGIDTLLSSYSHRSYFYPIIILRMHNRN